MKRAVMKSPLGFGIGSLVTVTLASLGMVVLAQGCGSSDSSSSSSFGAKNPSATSGVPSGEGSGEDAGGAANAGSDGVGFATGDASPPDAAPPCQNLQCQQVSCANGAHTTVSGTIYDPAGKNPLYDVVVYVPNSTPQPFVDHATCDTCAALYTGDPLVTALTASDGTFTLTDVPAGTNIPLVIQVGKWRRQITIPSVTSCVDNPLTNPDQTRLPKNQSEGDIPKIAVSTGSADSMECLLERIGVDEAEYGGATSSGRIHIFQGNGNGLASGNTSSESGLWDSAADLTAYDIVILSCEGGENAGTKPPASLQALEDYANAGGRVFASHFHYYWFEGKGAPADLTATASWFPGSNGIPASDPNGVTSASIDTSFPKGQAFQQWMQRTNALQTNGTLTIEDSRQNASVNPAVNTASQTWIADTTVPTAPNGGPTTMYFTFNTPTASPVASQCGRVVYSDLHVGAASKDYATSKVVPTGCTVGDLTPQEKALEFMLFDLSSCVQPDSLPPAPPPPTPPSVK